MTNSQLSILNSPLIPPGYKQTEVGTIPEEWEVRNLSDVSLKITDGDHVTPIRKSQGYYLLSARNVLNGRIDVSDVDYVGLAEYQRMKRRCGPEAGDILISCSGTIGRVAVVPVGFECVLVRSAALAKVDPELADGFFLQFWLQGSRAQWQIACSVNQGAQPNLFLNHIKRLVCPQPPLAEQRAIAEALSDVDELLGGLDRLIAKKRDLKQAAMQQLLIGQTRLPGFHGEWEVKSLSKICSMKSGEGITSANIDQFSKYPCYGGNGLRGYATRFTHDGSYALIGRQGALCGNVYGVEGRFFASEHAIVVAACEDTDIRWLTAVLARMNLNQYSESSAQPGLSVSKILKLKIAAPPTKTEQTAIAEVLRDMDAELVALERRREKTRALKQGMMQELLTGRTRLV